VLDTDTVNAREHADASLALAVRYYHVLCGYGYNPACARCSAIAYLRRKTGLSWPLAASAFDQHNGDTP
jgi:hypothetical protein